MNNISVTFEDVHDIIETLCFQMFRKYGGRYDDMYSSICLAYLKAYYSYDPSKQTRFTSWLWSTVMREIASEQRKGRRRQRLAPHIQLCFDLSGKEEAVFPLWELLEKLTPDGKLLVSLALDPPADIRADLRFSGRMRPAIKRFVLNMGWKRKRIEKAFREVQQALEVK